MTPASIAFTVIAGLLIAIVPRRLAAVPLLLTATYTTRAPVLEFGPANLSALRIVVLVGILRVFLRREGIARGANPIDRWVIAWAVLLITLSAFHTSDAWTYRIGMVLGDLGVYFLCRAFLQSPDDVRRLFAYLCVTLLPLAVLVVLEKYTAYNYFTVMGQLSDPNMRAGHVRAFGPFAHPILIGTVGATYVAMAMGVWRAHRIASLIGLVSALAILFACTSSGPLMMAGFICVAIVGWNMRTGVRLVRWAALPGLVALQIVMNDPVYFLMARIDLTGSSTGWHRAELIRSAIAHLDEWWAVGTDYTRHWMPTGIHANEFHTDITNHFLEMGVWGGLPLMLVFVLALVAAFRMIGRDLRAGQSQAQKFLLWTLGAALFGHVMNFWSISLFDQSVSYFYLVLAAIGATRPQPGPLADVAEPASSVIHPYNAASPRAVTPRPRVPAVAAARQAWRAHGRSSRAMWGQSAQASTGPRAWNTKR